MSQETEKQGFWVLHTQAAYLVNYKLADCIVLRPKDAQISFGQVGNFERSWEGVGRRPVWGGGLLERDGEERCGEKPARPPPQFVIGKKSFLDSGLKLGFGIRGLVFRYFFSSDILMEIF